MRGAILHAPGDVRVEQRDDPTIVQPTDAIIRLSATCKEHKITTTQARTRNVFEGSVATRG